MVDNYDVGIQRALAHARDEASIVVGALLAQTSFRTRIDVAPERKRLRKIRQLRTIAGDRCFGPVNHLVEVINFFESFEYGRTFRAS